MSSVAGVIFPVPERLVERLFDGKPRVFVKFLTHSSTKLRPKHKIVFYSSGGSKTLVGEAIIDKVEFLEPEKVMARYKERLLLDEDEFYAYVRRWPTRDASKEMLTLLLKTPMRYLQPVKYRRRMTMAGQYFRAEEYESLMRAT